MAVTGLLTACTSAVKAEPYDAGESPACQEVASLWPSSVGDAQPRETAVASQSVAAWGDPAIIARCGALPPGPTTDQCVDVAGVDWIAEELDDGWMFTTYGRDPAVEVLVPDTYGSDALFLTAFNEAAQQVAQTTGECS